MKKKTNKKNNNNITSKVKKKAVNNNKKEIKNKDKNKLIDQSKKEVLTEKCDDFIYVGEFKNGKKNGKGIIYYNDGSSIEGNWNDDELNGIGLYKNADLILSGNFVDGELCGQVIECDRETNKMVFKGEYQQGQRHGRGLLYMIDEGGGEISGNWVDGSMNGWGEFTFPNCNGRFKIEGTWLNGDLLKGKYVVNYLPLKDQITGKRIEITPLEREYMTLLESYYRLELSKQIKDFQIKYDPSTSDCISSSPMMIDIYERFHCYVKQSEIPNSGEGLFARISIPENTIISFYNGIRLTHDEVNNRSWDYNSNTISLDIDTVIDVPQHLNNTITQYASTISHKANHKVPGNNAVYSSFYHPRFGSIKSIKSIKPIKKDEEIFVDYDYNKNDIPSWYKV